MTNHTTPLLDRIAAYRSEMTYDAARRIAAEWHGGQWSALYAFASSGIVRADLELEIAREMATQPEASAERGTLSDLLAFVGAI